MKDLPPSVTQSIRVYRWLICVYSKAFRREFDEAMVQVFEDMASSAYQKSGLWGLGSLWFRVTRDLAWSALSEHRRGWEWRLGMKTLFCVLLSLPLVMIAQYLVMGVVLSPLLHTIQVSLGASPQEPIQSCTLWVLLCLAPIVTAAILVNLRWWYRPWLTAPLGAMALSFPYTILAPWMAILFGVLSLIGCFLGSRIAKHRREGTAPPEHVHSDNSTAAVEMAHQPRAAGPPTNTSYRSVGMACSRWSRIFVKNLTMFEVSSAER